MVWTCVLSCTLQVPALHVHETCSLLLLLFVLPTSSGLLNIPWRELSAFTILEHRIELPVCSFSTAVKWEMRWGICCYLYVRHHSMTENFASYAVLCHHLLSIYSVLSVVSCICTWASVDQLEVALIILPLILNLPAPPPPFLSLL